MRVVPEDEHYIVNWHTNEFVLTPGPTYRISVLVAGTVLGSADVIATFEDANLEAAVRAALGLGPQDDLTCAVIGTLTFLSLGFAGITSLEGIQNLTSLTELNLAFNSISDISASSGLTSLTELGLAFNSISDISLLRGLILAGSNSISDISPLSGLTSLTQLFLFQNSISNIGALAGLTNLTSLLWSFNSISDISALSGLTSLTTLRLEFNPNLSNIQPLLDNGLGAGDTVDLRNVDPAMLCTDVALLQAKGVRVIFNVCT